MSVKLALQILISQICIGDRRRVRGSRGPRRGQGVECEQLEFGVQKMPSIETGVGETPRFCRVVGQLREFYPKDWQERIEIRAIATR